MTDHPIFDALIDEHPAAVEAMFRPRWSYAAALKAADEAIAASDSDVRAAVRRRKAAAKKTTAPAKKAGGESGQTDAAIRSVQHWMASDLQSALGYEPNINPDPSFGEVGWADWWAGLCHEVRSLAFNRDLNASVPPPQRAHLMTAEHAHGIDTGGEVEAVLAGHVYEDFLGGLSEVWTTCTCGEKIDATFGGGRTCAEVFRGNWAAHIAAALAPTTLTRASAADAVLAEARRLCCGENPAAHHEATAKHSERMAFAGDLARAVRQG